MCTFSTCWSGLLDLLVRSDYSHLPAPTACPHFPESEDVLIFRLPKTYIVGFYDRFPCDPFLLQTPDFNLQVLLSNPKFACSLREKHLVDLKMQLRQLERDQRVIEESLIEKRCQIEIIQTVLRENGVFY